MVPDFLLDAMNVCIELAKEAAKDGNYPLGAAVTSPDGIIVSSKSALIKSHDPTAHPEITVMRWAAEMRSSRYLNGLYLVSTLEPCPMCTSAAIWAKMAGIGYGTKQETAKSWGMKMRNPLYTFRQIDIKCQYVADRGDPRVTIYDGIKEAECDALLRLVG